MSPAFSCCPAWCPVIGPNEQESQGSLQCHMNIDTRRIQITLAIKIYVYWLCLKVDLIKSEVKGCR